MICESFLDHFSNILKEHIPSLFYILFCYRVQNRYNINLKKNIFRCKPVYLSTRSGAWVVPNYIFGHPTDLYANRLFLALPWKLATWVFEKVIKLVSGNPKRFVLNIILHQNKHKSHIMMCCWGQQDDKLFCVRQFLYHCKQRLGVFRNHPVFLSVCPLVHIPRKHHSSKTIQCILRKLNMNIRFNV